MSWHPPSEKYQWDLEPTETSKRKHEKHDRVSAKVYTILITLNPPEAMFIDSFVEGLTR